MKPEDAAREAIVAGFGELPVFSTAAARVRSLPPHHRDPFDRLLVAQAVEGALTLLTADTRVMRYADSATIVHPAWISSAEPYGAKL